MLTGAEDVIPPFLKPVATIIGVYQASAVGSKSPRRLARAKRSRPYITGVLIIADKSDL